MLPPKELKTSVPYIEVGSSTDTEQDPRIRMPPLHGPNATFLLVLLTFLVSFLVFIQFSNIEASVTRNGDMIGSLRRADTIQKQTSERPNDQGSTQIPKDYKEMRKKALLEAEEARANLISLAAGDDNQKFYTGLKNEVHCPEIVRVGSDSDGGKFVCNPKKSQKDCTFLSLGLNNQIDYDIAIQKITEEQQCRILGADTAEQRENTKKQYASIRGTTFVGQIPETLTIEKMLERVGSNEIELMKMDIEGGEHKALEPFLKTHYVCQIFVEIHGTPTKQLEMMKKMARLGFRLFSYEPNPFCKPCCEYSYINELCMNQFGVIPLANTVPLD